MKHSELRLGRGDRTDRRVAATRQRRSSGSAARRLFPLTLPLLAQWAPPSPRRSEGLRHFCADQEEQPMPRADDRSGPAAAPGLFLDRDGVVNVDVGYLHRIEECVFVDGVFDLVRGFSARGFRPVIVTNQSGIGRGYYGEAEFRRLMEWMGRRFAAEGAPLAGIYHCPSRPDAGDPRRKPAPGMFIEAAAELGLDLARSWSVGDKEGDIAAGRAAGIGTLVRLDPSRRLPKRAGGHWVVPDLRSVRDLPDQNSRR
jgi:D-glycero-D-manno-heptose 1,7-bisphosphate phosphatase